MDREYPAPKAETAAQAHLGCGFIHLAGGRDFARAAAEITEAIHWYEAKIAARPNENGVPDDIRMIYLLRGLAYANQADGLDRALADMTSVITFKPAPDRWSIQECAEHIVSVEQLVQGQVIAKLLAGPPEPSRRAEVKYTDGFLITAMPDRIHKAQAPEMLVPKGRLATQEAVRTSFEACRKTLLDQVATSKIDWRTRFAPHPFFGTLDAYQWVLLSTGHTLRHTLQIEEVKRSPGYPAVQP